MWCNDHNAHCTCGYCMERIQRRVVVVGTGLELNMELMMESLKAGLIVGSVTMVISGITFYVIMKRGEK